MKNSAAHLAVHHAITNFSRRFDQQYPVRPRSQGICLPNVKRVFRCPSPDVLLQPAKYRLQIADEFHGHPVLSYLEIMITTTALGVKGKEGSLPPLLAMCTVTGSTQLKRCAATAPAPLRQMV